MKRKGRLMGSDIPRIAVDPTESNAFELVRQAVLMRLRHEPDWHTFAGLQDAFYQYVEVERSRDNLIALGRLLQEVFWELIIQEVLAPGAEGDINLPHFHVTSYGNKVLEKGEYLPHDPDGYLDRLMRQIPNPDNTVLAYIAESLNCFQRGALIGATVMLGVAAERVSL
jgi:hypothetical protein